MYIDWGQGVNTGVGVDMDIKRAFLSRSGSLCTQDVDGMAGISLVQLKGI